MFFRGDATESVTGMSLFHLGAMRRKAGRRAPRKATRASGRCSRFEKLEDGKDAGAHYLCVACPYCQIQFDTIQEGIAAKEGVDHRLPSLLYPQLLGLCMGVDTKTLGLEANQVPIQDIAKFLAQGRKGGSTGSPPSGNPKRFLY